MLRNVISASALTVMGCFLGVGAAKLPDTPTSMIVIALAMLGLALFYVLIELYYEAWTAKRWLRCCLIFIVCIGIDWAFSGLMSKLTGGFYTAFGIFLGWLLTAVSMSFWGADYQERMNTGDARND